MIKVIFFDASETLIHLPLGVAHHYTAVARRHGFEIEEKQIAAAFRAAWKSRPAREIIVGPRPDDDKGWWRGLVSEVLRQCDCAPSAQATARLFEELYAEFTKPGVWELYSDVLPTLGELRAEFRLGVISNFDRRLYTVLEHLGIARYFETIVLSSETGADKPHREVFHRALELVRVEASDALHVGDDPALDWQGAQTAGLHVFPLERPRNSLRDVRAFAASAHR